QRWSAGDTGREVTFDARGPDLLAGLRIDCVGVGFEIAKEHRISCGRPGRRLDGAERHGVADAGFALERPVHAAGGSVEGVDESGVGADEDAAGYGGGLAEGRRAVRVAEGPLELEARDRRGSEAGSRGGLEAVVVEAVAPAVPARAPQIVQRRVAGAAIGH